MTLDAQASFVTEVQRACREARESRSKAALEKAADLLDRPEYDALPEKAKIDLGAAFGAAVIAVTGALA